ncbi:hypothetical protein BC833DRAFT_661681 [Globomyces pollinis-pini]|nr:hypothetical protein BC833DRAFT_661681 [Globomyces pollinis-pini]
MTFAILLIQLLGLQVLSKPTSDSCVSISKTTACAPWTKEDLFIDAEKLGRVYKLKEGIEMNALVWQKALLESTSGGPTQGTIWQKYIGCSGYKGDLIQYDRSYTCYTDIFVHSARCNKNVKKVRPLCTKTCKDYGLVLKALLNDAKFCPKADPITAKQTKHRERLLRVGDMCEKVGTMSIFDTDATKCLPMVTSDQNSCGFGGDEKTGAMYCQVFPEANCCKKVDQEVEGNKPVVVVKSNDKEIVVTDKVEKKDAVTPIQKLESMWESAVGSTTTDTDKKSPINAFFTSPAFIVGISIIGIFIVGASAYLYKTRRAKSMA